MLSEQLQVHLRKIVAVAESATTRIPDDRDNGKYKQQHSSKYKWITIAIVLYLPTSFILFIQYIITEHPSCLFY